MTRKDYELIAHVIRETVGSDGGSVAGYDAIEAVAWRMAHHLKQDNPRFDRGRFLDACGMPDEVGKGSHPFLAKAGRSFR